MDGNFIPVLPAAPAIATDVGTIYQMSHEIWTISEDTQPVNSFIIQQ